MFVTSLDLPAAEHVEIVADAVEQGERIGCDRVPQGSPAELQDQLLHDENAFGVESQKVRRAAGPVCAASAAGSAPAVSARWAAWRLLRRRAVRAARRSNGAGSDAGW